VFSSSDAEGTFEVLLNTSKSIKSSLGFDVLQYHTQTCIHFSYCLAGILFWHYSLTGQVPQKITTGFQRVLHAVTRTVLNLKLHDQVTPALQELHWLPVTERIQYKLCLLVHKLLLGHMLTPVADIPARSPLHASSCCNLVIPRTRRRIDDRAFSVAASCAWNRLPTDLKLLQSIDLFHRKLKTFLFKSEFRHQGTRLFLL